MESENDDCRVSVSEGSEEIDSGDELEIDMEPEYNEEELCGSDMEIDEYLFEVLSVEDVVNHMIDSINEVYKVTQIPTTTIRILLHHFNWDKEKLMEKFYSEDQNKIFKEAQVLSPYRYIKPGNSSKSLRECGLCYLSLPLEMVFTGLDCGHFYCTECWIEYLTTKIMDEGASQMIECPGCNIVVDDQTVMKLITDPSVKLKYQHLITNSFVQCNRLLRWCPSPGCTNVIKVEHVEARPVKCKCSHEFCFSCSQNVHDLVPCNLIKKWWKKCDDDSETNNWMLLKTKECPKCSAIIEKDGGCNHVICTNKSCKTEFCWACLREWRSHAHVAGCNRYDDMSKSKERSKAATALSRYLFYNNRYLIYLQSLKNEKNYYSQVDAMMEAMQKHNMSWIEVQFLKKSLDILCECRRTLMFSFVFAYYLNQNNHLFVNNHSTIFEDNQKDLQTATEELSGYFGREFSAETLVKMKIKVQDQYRYCDSRRKILLAYVQEGYEKDWWDFNESF